MIRFRSARESWDLMREAFKHAGDIADLLAWRLDALTVYVGDQRRLSPPVLDAWRER